MASTDGLTDLRAHLQTLHAPGGPYHVICAKTGSSPVPVDGLQFDDRRTAAEAARAAASYRGKLREYDSAVAYCDLVVCERDVAVHPPGRWRPPQNESNAEP
ncbi:DUF7552 domain-containing protein [Haloarchaeobius sp. DFWS5]|uniref:DUF7552 domain-containing protein n=1 Tax=Haloarchaeobius sp. DFWS5 TaxID=3446114 RepID=UPI003EBCC351